ncbi:uncharacterized protein LOC113505905 [Trichoplusia ni]|uniref:Uncharacterized protein LOC113505905 n=1 Tax=Trichoplusia ni TaxID=7111 RepID=A0A7E5WUQ5_TRINI|nr:uncharacterized protein LOC113505905 [Trichoplusia ni]
MGSLGFWSMVVILLQSVLAVVISWLTLDCKFAPLTDELHEITLMKVLYLYDPEACGRIHFYNLTSTVSFDRTYTSVVWPVTNLVASRFRTKIQLWLALHLIWLLFAIVNVTQGQRSCSFYATLLPFTITGVTLLVCDVIYAILFLVDARYTSTESTILRYLSVKGRLRAMNKRPITPGAHNIEDTSWIAVVLAYISMRGIVQWVVNFWIVKDNYYEGLERYRQKLRLSRHKARAQRISSNSQL